MSIDKNGSWGAGAADQGMEPIKKLRLIANEPGKPA
jgi:hypothetical protein